MALSSNQPYQPPANGFRTFLIVWITQSVSVFGSALTFFAITIWLTLVLYPNPDQKPLLAASLSATGLAWTLASIIVAPFAGAWADRHDRKRTMMAMDFLSGCLSILLAVLIITHALQLWILLIGMALNAIFSAFHYSAFDTSYIMLVPENRLPRANGMMQTMISLSSILSPAVAATLIAVPALVRQGGLGGLVGMLIGRLSDGTSLAISIDAITFFLAAGNSPLSPYSFSQADGPKSWSVWQIQKPLGGHQGRRTLYLASPPAPLALGYLHYSEPGNRHVGSHTHDHQVQSGS